jgi:hypothetical protein
VFNDAGTGHVLAPTSEKKEKVHNKRSVTPGIASKWHAEGQAICTRAGQRLSEEERHVFHHYVFEDVLSQKAKS